ncbi:MULTISPECIES: thioesterase [unclassified Exiguobacterium]|uniref:thioesterase family protein n=1 Tax=unclassified Exiguobacterium TaxID=2644629 RepID=UPI000B5933EF|nr:MULTISPECIES: thioesterase [unclassified Exiguobacterium]ASI34382.1 thioesterase [Exiguobacterium sp. N4-1P]
MKPGLALGQTARVETTVTEEMFAQFEGTVVHPAYSTVSMVYHMEWAARKIILPYLESSEEGVGGAVNVKHLNMAPLGSQVSIIATVTELRDNRVRTKIDVTNEHGLIGVGEVTQIILDKRFIEDKLTTHVF